MIRGSSAADITATIPKPNSAGRMVANSSRYTPGKDSCRIVIDGVTTPNVKNRTLTLRALNRQFHLGTAQEREIYVR
jgi:hypothetical protein